MRNNRLLKYLLLFCVLSVSLFAVGGKIKVFIKSSDAIYTSQKVTVAVELLSNAFSITNAKIDFPASSQYIVQAPKSAAYLGKVEVEGEDWQMVHYEYDVYALRAGKLSIPALTVSFTASMGYGQPTKEFSLQSEMLTFAVKTPEGVNPNDFVLVTDKYKLTMQMKPDKGKLIVGDAVEMHIVQQAQGVPDILLRPLGYTSNAFLRVYEKEPELQSGLKGSYDVSRTERFTFVASSEGNVTLPAKQVRWWHAKNKKLQVETIPAISFEILPDPQIAIDAKKAVQKQRLIYSVSVVLLVLLAYILFAKKVTLYLRERKRRYKLSEAGRFKTLLKSCDEGDVTQIYHDFYDWLDSISPSLARKGFREIENIQPSFANALGQFELLLATKEERFDSKAFIVELKKLRVNLLAKDKKEASLGSLNP